jgi:hypothetical protein
MLAKITDSKGKIDTHLRKASLLYMGVLQSIQRVTLMLLSRFRRLGTFS